MSRRAGLGRSSGSWVCAFAERRSKRAPTDRLFPACPASDSTTFAPTYRCGAAPDSHRVPFSARRAMASSTEHELYISWSIATVKLSVVVSLGLLRRSRSRLLLRCGLRLLRRGLCFLRALRGRLLSRAHLCDV